MKRDEQWAPPHPFWGCWFLGSHHNSPNLIQEPHGGQNGSTALGRRRFTVLGSVWSDREMSTELRSLESPPLLPFGSLYSQWLAGTLKTAADELSAAPYLSPLLSANSWDLNNRSKSRRRN